MHLHALRSLALALVLVASAGCDQLAALGIGGDEEKPRPEPPAASTGGAGALSDKPAGPGAGQGGEYKKGDKVRVEWQGSIYPATILAVNGKAYFIHYDGWGSEWDETVGPGRIKGRR